MYLQVIESKEAAEDVSFYQYDAASDEEVRSGLVESGVKDEMEYMKKAVKYYSLSSYMLKPSHLLTHGFKNNRKTQEKLFKQMYSFGAR